MAAESKVEKKSKFTVLQNLRHDGKHYPKGETVQLTDDQAKVLVDRKVVASPKAATATE